MFSKNVFVLVSISWNVNKLCFNNYCAFILFAAVTIPLGTIWVTLVSQREIMGPFFLKFYE